MEPRCRLGTEKQLKHTVSPEVWCSGMVQTCDCRTSCRSENRKEHHDELESPDGTRDEDVVFEKTNDGSWADHEVQGLKVVGNWHPGKVQRRYEGEAKGKETDTSLKFVAKREFLDIHSPVVSRRLWKEKSTKASFAETIRLWPIDQRRYR